MLCLGLKRVGVGDGSDFSVTITEGGAQKLQCSFKPGSDECQIKHDPKVGDQILNIILLFLGGPTWRKPDKPSHGEQRCQVPLHLFNQVCSKGLWRLRFLLLAQHFLYKVRNAKDKTIWNCSCPSGTTASWWLESSWTILTRRRFGGFGGKTSLWKSSSRTPSRLPPTSDHVIHNVNFHTSDIIYILYI